MISIYSKKISIFVLGINLIYPFLLPAQIPHPAVGLLKTSQTEERPIAYSQNLPRYIRLTPDLVLPLKNHIFFSFHTGKQFILRPYHSAFDTATLVDFTRHHNHHAITAGYFLWDRIGLGLTTSWVYTGKRTSIDSISAGGGNGIVVSGSGYAGAQIKAGLNCRLVYYKKNYLNLFTDIKSGIMIIQAGGGRGTRKIGMGSGDNPQITRKKQNSYFTDVSLGADWRLGKRFSIVPSVNLSFAPLKSPIGSVEAFSGIAFHVGVQWCFGPINN